MSKKETCGIIMNYRTGPRTQRNKELILLIPGVTSRKDASKLIGKRVECRLSKKVLSGKIMRAHGKTGKVLARFDAGPPAQILGSKIAILE
jgi:ribosomal protein L35AE/L33A